MAMARIPRRRGGLCGFLLVLLGLWGGLVPFVGPYFHFGFTPDKAWSYSSGRLYLSVLPGVAAFLAGLVVMSTRSRTAGMLGGFLAAAAGAWFAAGTLIMTTLRQPSASPGQPIGLGAAATWRTTAEQLGLFGGLGVVVVFFGALAIGRFSMLGARDAAAALRAQEQADEGDFTAATQQFPQATAGSADAGQLAAGHELFEPRDQAGPLPRRSGPQLPDEAGSETVTTSREPTGSPGQPS